MPNQTFIVGDIVYQETLKSNDYYMIVEYAQHENEYIKQIARIYDFRRKAIYTIPTGGSTFASLKLA